MIIMLKYTKICTLLLIELVAFSVKSIGGEEKNTTMMRTLLSSSQ